MMSVAERYDANPETRGGQGDDGLVVFCQPRFMMPFRILSSILIASSAIVGR